MSHGFSPELARMIEAAIREHVDALQRAGSSIDPSAIARHLDPDDPRPLMGPVREVARDLAARGVIEVVRHGKPVGPWPWRGVIRLRRPRSNGNADSGSGTNRDRGSGSSPGEGDNKGDATGDPPTERDG